MDKNEHSGVIKTLEDLRHEFAPLINVNDIHKSKMTASDKIALFITNHVGTMAFFYICVVLVTVPLIAPTTLPIIQYISAGLLQLLLLPLIMISQNLQGRHSELRAQHAYETNIKSEKEIEAVLLHLEKQDTTMLEILERLDKLEKKV